MSDSRRVGYGRVRERMMERMTDRQIAEYFRRSYTAVDGLWFMKVEGQYGFEAALRMDEEVWKVLPKIQARMLMSMIGLNKGMEGLCRAVETRLDLEGFEFEAEKDANSLKIHINRCPWHDLMVKSGRESLSGRVGDLICGLENAVWASEFGDIAFERSDRICKGDERCVLSFRQ
jgi:hypothetical protein